jgi:hypothetical protein
VVTNCWLIFLLTLVILAEASKAAKLNPEEERKAKGHIQ